MEVLETHERSERTDKSELSLRERLAVRPKMGGGSITSNPPSMTSKHRKLVAELLLELDVRPGWRGGRRVWEGEEGESLRQAERAVGDRIRGSCCRDCCEYKDDRCCCY